MTETGCSWRRRPAISAVPHIKAQTRPADLPDTCFAKRRRIHEGNKRHDETLRRASFTDALEGFGLDFIPGNHIVRILLVVRNSTIQFGHL